MNRDVFFRSVKASLFRGRFSQSQVNGINTLLDAFETSNIGMRHQAYLLATAYHETAHTMQPIHERGPRSYFNKYDGRLGNSKPGDGYIYRGRGYVQITGKANYAKAGRILKIPLVSNPEHALDPRTAAQILIRGCMEGWFTGRKLSDTTDFVQMRRVVNGMDRAYLIAGYAEAFMEALDLGEEIRPGANLGSVVTGKPAVASKVSFASLAGSVSTGAMMVEQASGTISTVVADFGIKPEYVLVGFGVIAIAAFAFNFIDRRIKAHRDGV